MTSLRSMVRAAFMVALMLAAGPAHDHGHAQQAAALATIALPAELDRVLRDYEAAWHARDAARLAALFHPDGFVLSSGSPPVHGRDAITRHYRNAGGALHLRALAYQAADTVAYIIGLYGSTATDQGGKYVLALRRENAGQPWLIAADIDNRNSR